MHEPTNQHMFERLLHDNEDIAQHNREHFTASGALVINIMSAPGAGKTSLISATAKVLKDRYRCLVIEGDMVGELDSERIRKEGIPALQISTGRTCHLDARMIQELIHRQSIEGYDLVIIENVGNLVCPAEFPLGEHRKVVLLSVTEGDDKPFKYPVIFRNCDAVIMNKCDLLPFVKFNPERAESFINGLNSKAKLFQLSAEKGDGMNSWITWLEGELEHRPIPSSKAKNHVHISAG